jgi:porin
MLQGGPVYPLPTPGIRLQVKPTDKITILTAIFSGAPAGANCMVSPQICNNTGTTFSFSGGVLSISEVQYAVNQEKDAKGLPGVLKAGGWYESATFPDLHLGLTAAGVPVSLASAATVAPLNHQGNWGVYGVADQMVWRAAKGPQSANVLLRGGASPSGRNLVAFYVDGGLGFKAPLPSRDDDVLTFGFVWSNISSDLAALDVDAQFLTGMFRPVYDHEAILEMDYSLQLAPWWTVQTDARYVNHPGGHVLDPLNPSQAIPDAFVVTVRNSVKF